MEQEDDFAGGMEIMYTCLHTKELGGEK